METKIFICVVVRNTNDNTWNHDPSDRTFLLSPHIFDPVKKKVLKTGFQVEVNVTEK